jgi:DNA replication protein DnaC
MNEIATLALLQEQLRELNLTNMARHIETHLRQARNSGTDHAEFLAGLTEMEVRTRAAHRNVILLGKSGTGKTHLATALGIEACRQNQRIRFVTGYALANELIEARGEKELGRLVGRYARLDLLILDELVYVPFSKEGAELLFQILAERHERGSVMITTNLGFADWTQIFGDANMTAALLDRLTHHAHIIECDWDSHRLKQAMKASQATAATTGRK